MLIPFGVFSAGVSSGGVSAGSFDLLATTLLTTTATSVTFDTSTYAALGYKHLQIRIATMYDFTNSMLVGRFNADGGTNYSYHSLSGNGVSVNANSGSTKSNMVFAYNQDNSSTTVPNVCVIDILDAFSTSKYKTTRSLGGVAGGTNQNQIWLGSSSWRSTSAITSVVLSNSSSFDGWQYGNFRANSRFSLYGLKG